MVKQWHADLVAPGFTGSWGQDPLIRERVWSRVISLALLSALLAIGVPVPTYRKGAHWAPYIQFNFKLREFFAPIPRQL